MLNVSFHVTQYLSLIAGMKREILELKSDLAAARSVPSPTHNHLSDSVNRQETEELKAVRAEIVRGFHERYVCVGACVHVCICA